MNEQAILRTLVYSDIFDYPLTRKEIWQWLIESDNVSMFQCLNVLKKLPEIDEKDGFYFLKGREKIVALRKKREKWSVEKLRKAKKTAQLLRLIPWVKLVGVTGGLATNNADKDDDIDILIVSTKNRVWLTRLVSTILIELTGNRRHPENHKPSCGNLARRRFKDKICLNMFLDEEHLAVTKEERDLYTAHEVLQMKPLWNKDSTYQKFLIANSWVKQYLPNIFKFKVQSSKFKVKMQSSKFFQFLILSCNFAFCILHFAFIEKLVKVFQLWYMKNNRTTEIITDSVIRFHPQDARKWVLEKYNQKLKRLSVIS